MSATRPALARSTATLTRSTRQFASSSRIALPPTRPSSTTSPTSSARSSHVPTFKHNHNVIASLRSRFSSTASKNAAKSSEDKYASGELTPTPLGQELYDRISERDMETLHEHLEDLCENCGADGWEVEYSAGVLNLSLPPHGTYVLNKQPPNQQIWMSSPISGPCRFGFLAASESEAAVATDAEAEDVEGTWNHFRQKGVTLGGLLEGEIRELCAQEGVGEGWTGVGIA